MKYLALLVRAPRSGFGKLPFECDRVVCYSKDTPEKTVYCELVDTVECPPAPTRCSTTFLHPEGSKVEAVICRDEWGHVESVPCTHPEVVKQDPIEVQFRVRR